MHSVVARPLDAVAPIERAAPLAQVDNPCALCGGTDAARQFRVDGAWIVRCPRCGLVREATRARSLHARYDSAYYANDSSKGGYANYVLDAAINRLTFARRLRAIERRRSRNGRLLDVGCALGDFVLEAAARGWIAEGVEVSAYAVARARERGVVAYAGTLEELALPDARYDVVTLYDTIEHLADPVGTLLEIRRLLAPGGLLHVVTPNVAGMQARLLRRYWYHYKPGEHLFYFSPVTLRAALERAGFVWEGWRRSGSYVTVSYALNRLRYYAPGPFGLLERIPRALRLGPFPFSIDVGEMEAWARRAD